MTRSVFACGALMLAASGAMAQAVPIPEQSAPKPTLAEKVRTLKATSAYGVALTPEALGDFSRDNVYTAVTPCRIVDTRVAGAGGPVSATRTFDVDGSTFAAQGGFNGSCGIPSGVASAVAMTITTPTSTGNGRVIAWGLGTQPLASALVFATGKGAANTTIVPVVPGPGNDFSVSSSPATQIIIDVVGYFSAPLPTALDCTSVSSGTMSVPPNAYTAVDAACPAGYTVTGGGTFPTEGTLGRINIWMDGSPSGNSWRTWVDNQTGASRSMQTYARCCRVPGR